MSYCVGAAAIIYAAVVLSARGANPAQPTPPVPRTVSLKANAITVRDALDYISRNSGNPQGIVADKPDNSIKIDFSTLGFWQALDTLAAASKCRLDLYRHSGRLALVPGNGAPIPPLSYDGFFRSSVRKIVATRDFESGKSGTMVHLEVAWEPRLEPLFLETRPRNVLMKDDRNQAIAIPVESGVRIPVDGKPAVSLDVPLPALPRPAAKIGTFAGKLTAIAPTAMLTLTFDTLTQLANAKPGAKELERSEQGMTCTLTKVDLLSDRTTVQVRLDLPSGGLSLESFQSWVVNNAMWLERKDKLKRAPANYSLDGSSSHFAVLSYHFTANDVLARPGDWSVVYRTPAGLVEVPFSFSFKDLPLP